MGATHTPPVVASAREDGADVGVPGRHRATDEEVGGAVSPTEASLSRRIVAPYLDAAYNLARWLTLDPDDARDAVREAVLHAVCSLAGHKGGDARPWFLAIVRDAVLASRTRERRAEVILFSALDREDGEPFVEALASEARENGTSCRAGRGNNGRRGPVRPLMETFGPP